MQAIVQSPRANGDHPLREISNPTRLQIYLRVTIGDAVASVSIPNPFSFCGGSTRGAIRSRSSRQPMGAGEDRGQAQVPEVATNGNDEDRRGCGNPRITGRKAIDGFGGNEVEDVGKSLMT